jgi:hypothetical protein
MANETTSTSTPQSAPPCPGPKVEYWEDLTSTYGLDDESTADATPDGGAAAEQTVMQEYDVYVKAVLSPKGTDIIKFWVVSNSCMARTSCLRVGYR